MHSDLWGLSAECVEGDIKLSATLYCPLSAASRDCDSTDTDDLLLQRKREAKNSQVDTSNGDVIQLYHNTRLCMLIYDVFYLVCLESQKPKLKLSYKNFIIIIYWTALTNIVLMWV